VNAVALEREYTAAPVIRPGWIAGVRWNAGVKLAHCRCRANLSRDRRMQFQRIEVRMMMAESVLRVPKQILNVKEGDGSTNQMRHSKNKKPAGGLST
jgi:hypothetical protein